MSQKFLSSRMAKTERGWLSLLRSSYSNVLKKGNNSFRGMLDVPTEKGVSGFRCRSRCGLLVSASVHPGTRLPPVDMGFSEIDQLPAALQEVATYQQFAEGQFLFHRNEPAQTLYAVKTGRIRLLHFTQSGQSISHYTIYAGELCAEVVLFLDVYACSAIAEEFTQVLAFPKQTFLAAIQQDGTLAMAFMRQVSYRLHMTKLMVELRSIRSATERVLHYLHLVAHPEHHTVILEQPLKEIATDLGITPEAFSRTLTQLESEGIITRDKRKITLMP